MGINPRIVAQDVRFLWDGVSQRLPKGQVIDVAPGGALEDAIGAENLVPFATPARSAPVVTEPPVEEVPAVKPAETVPPQPEKPTPGPAAPVKKQDDAAEAASGDAKDGDS